MLAPWTPAQIAQEITVGQLAVLWLDGDEQDSDPFALKPGESRERLSPEERREALERRRQRLLAEKASAGH